MRRLISITAAIALAGTTAFAAPAITNKDAANNIINISGDAVSGDTVSILIVNPGYKVAEVYTNPSEAQQYVRSAVVSDEAYSFDIAMNVPAGGGGVYTAVLNNGGKTENFEFSFYPVESKLDVIASINKADSPSELTSVPDGSDESVLDKAIKVYGLDSFALTNDVKKNDLAAIIIAESGNGFANNADKVYDSLKASVYVAALNNSSVNAFKNGYLANPEIIEIDETDIYIDYTASVNNEGVEKIRSSLCGQNFKTVEAMVDAFESNTVLQLIVNNIKYGNGHVSGILDKYERILENAGFRLSRLSGINKKSDLYDALISSNAQTLEELAGVFNIYQDSEAGSGSGNKGGSMVGGSKAKVSSTPSSVPDYIPSEADTPFLVVFDDIDSVEWARESIEALASNGIVNGKGNNKFDPEGVVTRSEFTKMIIGAAALTDLNAKCAFKDVADEWAKPYVASAANLGIVTGITADEFGPGNPINRQQAAVIVYRTLNAIGVQLGGNAIAFEDTPQIEDYAREAVDKLSAAKIINGKGNNLFAPLDALTRAEAAKIIYTALADKIKTE